MLCSQNTGKYLTGKWHEDRYLAGREIDNFTTSDQSFLDMDGTLLGPLGKLDQFDSTMNIQTSPVDPYGEVEDYDYRDNPEVGY